MTDDDDFTGRDPGFPVAPLERVELRRSELRDGEELPLRLLVLNDLGRRPTAEERWRPVELTKETFDQAVFGDGVELELTVPNHIDEGGPPLAVQLQVRKLSDLEPEAVVRSQPEMRRLLEIRRALTAIKGPLMGEKAFHLTLRRMVADPETRALFAAGFGAEATVSTIPAYLERVAALREEAASSCDPARLSELAHNGDDVIAGRVAQNPATPLACLHWPLSGRFPEEVARHPAVLREVAADLAAASRLARPCAQRVLAAMDFPVDVLEAWSRSDDVALRALAAGCPRSPEPLLERLAADENDDVAWAVGENPRTSLPVLRSLFVREQRRHDTDHPNHRMCAIAASPRTPPDVLARLASHKHWKVRRGVASNPAAPTDLLARLAADDDGEVRHALITNPSASRELLLKMLSRPGNSGEQLVSSPTLRASDVEALAMKGGFLMRRALARRADLEPATLRLLEGDPDELVRREAARTAAKRSDEGGHQRGIR